MNGALRFLRIVTVGCTVLMLVAACASSTTPVTSGHSTPSAPPVTSSSAPPERGVVQATFADDGHTVELAVGQPLRVALGSTFWQFAPLAGAVLRIDVRPRPQPAASCIPGGGCGTTTATYVAVTHGKVDVAAHRAICGEAMGCTAKTGTFVLHVVVR